MIKENYADKAVVTDAQVTTGFTLAEVLITLGIIGIVAAMTIPTLIANYQKTQYIVGLKKAYSVVNQILLLMSNDNGTPGDLRATGLFATGTNSLSLGNEFTKYLKVVKNCGISTNQDCWPDLTYFNYDGSDSLNTTNFNALDDKYYKFLTADGMSFIVINYAYFGGVDDNCAANYSTGKTGNLTQKCGEVYVDINGRRGPNILGRDTFMFHMTNGKGAVLYPVGGSDDIGGWWQTYGLCGTRKIATSCAAKIIEQGWQMNY